MIRYNFDYLDGKLSSSQVVSYVAAKSINFAVKDPKRKHWAVQVWKEERNRSQSAFLLQPKLLFENKIKAEMSEIYRYIQLASLRSYISYVESGISSVPLAWVEDDLDIDKLKFNRLLTITNTYIVFMYE